MEIIKCIIVDDEPLARELLVGFSAHVPQLQVVGIFGNALDARSFFQQNPVDLIFLDINMPVLDGIGLLNTLVRRPHVIMTTAYKEYAVNAFELEVCDYLVKPFSLERFIVAVDRVIKQQQYVKNSPERPGDKEDALFLKTDGKIYRIEFNTLLFAEASGNYTRIVTADNILMPAMPFSGLEKLLPASQFIKVHRSFVINKKKITLIEGNRLFIDRHEIPIGRSYKEDFFARLNI